MFIFLDYLIPNTSNVRVKGDKINIKGERDREMEEGRGNKGEKCIFLFS